MKLIQNRTVDTFFDIADTAMERMAMDIKQKAFEIHQKLWALTKKYLEPDMLQTNQTDKYWDDLIADYNELLNSIAGDPKYVNEFAENMVVGITRLLEGVMREERKKDV